MHISIIGCSHYHDYQVLKWQLDELKITQITTCGDGNIELLAERYADEKNIKLKLLWPDQQMGKIGLWRLYYELLDSSDTLSVFWFGESDHVQCMINKAKRMGKKVIITRGYKANGILVPLSKV